jgi:hypothetical protein
MLSYFVRFLLIFIFCIFTQLGSAQYRSLPVGMSKKRFKQIQSRKYGRAEIAGYSRSNSGSSFFGAFSSSYVAFKPTNNNKINRNKNQKLIARKRKIDNNYQLYRDYIEKSNRGVKSNFSIYDK